MKFYLLALLLVSSFSVTAQSMKEMAPRDRVKYFFDHLSKDRMDLVSEFYHPNTEFLDPIGSMKGSDKVKAYYTDLYKNVEELKFEFSNFVESGNEVVAIWKMTLKTEKLNGGEAFSVDGNSVVKFDDTGKAIYHRDYFDMGEFIYERVPVIGFVVRKIKSRMQVKEEK